MDTDELLVFVVVLSKAPVRVLTLLDEGEWHLPRFTYSVDCAYDSSFCARDLESTLNSSSTRFSFDVVAELFPRQDNNLAPFVNPNGLNRLTLLETQSDKQLDYDLPAHASWADVHDVVEKANDEMLAYYYYYVPSAVSQYLYRYKDPRAYLLDPRATERWTHRAVKYLVSIVREFNLQPTSDVTRVAWGSSSELFRVNTCKGWYYLKAPSPGCAELAVTKRIYEIFPDDTLQVVAVNESLSCFVAKGFDCVLDVPDDVWSITLNKLARIQRESLPHLAELKELGIPEYSPAVLGRMIDEWVLDPVVAKTLRKREMTSEELTCRLKKVCDRMERSAIPLTLVHGDFAARNLGRRDDVVQDRGYILFDWQYACITHPFCDFYLKRGRSEQEYQGHWLDFVTQREAEVERRLAAPLSWMAQMGLAMRAKEVGGRRNRCTFEWRLECAVSALVSFVTWNEDSADLYE